MATAKSKPQSGKSALSAAGPGSVSASALLHDRSKVGAVRRSTPDSQAVGSGSSDEEHDHAPLARITSNSSSQPKTARRASWLSEINPMPQRKASFTGGSMSGNSNPPTPSGDGNIWSPALGASSGSSVSRGQSHATAGRNDQSWTVQARKEGPSRLKEVLQISTAAGGTACNFDDQFVSSPASHASSFQGPVFDEAYPVHMPLQPTLKNYRSQSYSVGQEDHTNGQVTQPHAAINPNRMRGGFASTLRNRTSRPGLLNQKSHDKLGRLREVDDDDESGNGPDHGAQLSSDQNGIHTNPERNPLMDLSNGEHLRLRSRRATTSLFPLENSEMDELAAVMSAYAVNSAQSEFAVEEAEPEPNQSNGANGLPASSLSEYASAGGRSYHSADAAPNSSIGGVQRGHWSSSLGFGSIDEGSQSRRHSLADVPARRYSLYAEGRHGLRSGLSHHGGETESLGQGLNRESLHFHYGASQEEQALQSQYSHARKIAASYFSGDATNARHLRSSDADISTTYGDPNPYGIPQSLGAPRAALSLHIVTFKCRRADVFYIQEGTGLKVEANDLVIVEADRGTDLGTVAHPNVTWAEARELRERYAKEHYKCLMIFSHHSTANQGGYSSGMLALSNGNRPSVAGGMGPQGANQSGQESAASELRPKMIRRQAQPHEVTALQEKEGNEAKAKRVCQQKVMEHRLNMEILDAEFQMDWKKLTFYYFAEEYINFNTLVTEIFKIYKTRIWMSAINPASFATPSAGLATSLASGSGPSLGAYGRSVPRSQRAMGVENPYSSFGPVVPMFSAFNQMYDPGSPNNVNRTSAHGNYMPYAPQTFDPATRGPSDGFAYAPALSRPASQVLNPFNEYAGPVYPSPSPISPRFTRGMAMNGYGAPPSAATNGYAASSRGLVSGFADGPQGSPAGYPALQRSPDSGHPGPTERQNGHGNGIENKQSRPNGIPSWQHSSLEH